MANDNIFQQYLTPPKSVLDYGAEYDAADNRKQSLAQNALQLAAGQQKFGETQQAGQRAAQLRAVLTGLPQGATDDDRIKAMRSAGSPEGFAAADALDKSLVDRRKGMASAGKDEGDTAEKAYKLKIEKHDQALRDMSSFQSPQEAMQSLQQHVASGELPPEQAQMFATQLQTMSPADFPKWQLGMVQRLMSAKDDMSYRTPDANNVATNARIKAEGDATRDVTTRGQNITAGTAAARLAFDKEKEAGSEDSALGPMATRMIAQQYLAGDGGALGNIGRGAQGAKNLTTVRNEVARQANAQGLNGADIAAKMAEFQGAKAGQRTLGTRTANIEVAAAEAAELAPLALEASAKVVRSGFLPFGKAQIMFNANTNDPNMREFAMANNALVNAFGQVMSRGGAATVSDKEHARELLSTAFDQPSYARAVGQLNKEIDAARKAPGKVRKEMSNAASGRAGDHDAPTAASGTKPSLSSIFGN